jgi:hypothetical protein
MEAIMNYSAIGPGGIALTLCIASMVTPSEAVAQFSGPLFGLATAPNGQLLVADTGAGVVDVQGISLLKPILPGITDISPIGGNSLWVTHTGTDPTANSGQGLYRVSNGKARLIADLFAFEQANNPHPPAEQPESNPFDVQALDGDMALVVDAAANDLLLVDSEGHVEVLATFPDALASTANIKSLVGCPAGPPDICGLPPVIPAQPVPTSIAIGPDGWYYVGELKGFPAPTGESRIWRVAPWASWADCGSSDDCQVVFDGGFTSIIDLAFGPDDLLYVVELDEASWFAPEVGSPTTGTINACDVGTLSCVDVETDLVLPTAITFGKDGTLWSTEFALIPPLARVVAIP